VPAGTIVVSESGQRTRADLERLAAAGVDAVLIGEAIMRAEDVEGKVREVLGTTVNPYFQAELEKRLTKSTPIPDIDGGGGGGAALPLSPPRQ
jgi:2-methylisocitrate lyase-like PEP mutase family enzyme